MVQAWYYNKDSSVDPRERHEYDPPRPVSLDQLSAIGVLHWEFDVSNTDTLNERVQALMTERKYKNKDVISVSRDSLPNYDEKLKSFFTEHIHDDEEIRLILQGAGFFDVRDANDAWIRIHCVPGDLLLLPAGIYHRFILDKQDVIQAMRIFKEDPKWTPINRDDDVSEGNVNRKAYIASIAPQDHKSIR